MLTAIALVAAEMRNLELGWTTMLGEASQVVVDDELRRKGWFVKKCKICMSPMRIPSTS